MNKEQLEEIVSADSFKWIKIKRFDPKCFFSEDGGQDTSLQYQYLRKHHDQESNYLINTCRELAGQVLKQAGDLKNQTQTIKTHQETIKNQREEIKKLESRIEVILAEY